MAFLDGLNGGAKRPASSGSSPFLSGVRQRSDREKQVAGLQVEAERAKAESDKANSPAELAKRTVMGIPKVLQDVGKAVIDEPMKTLATPIIRAEQAAFATAGRLTGNENLERAANMPLEFPSMFGGSGGTIEPQRGFDQGGAQQIAGDALKYGATVYTGAKAPAVAAKSFLGQITRAGAQGAFEGGVGGGLYMGGDALAREGSTAKDVAREFATGAGIGLGAGGLLGAGGAALARPGALRAAAEAEAKRLRPLPVKDMNPPDPSYRFHETDPKNVNSIRLNGLRPSEGQYGRGVYFAPEAGKSEAAGEGAIFRVDRAKLPKDYDEFPEQGWTEQNVPPESLDVSLDGGKTWYSAQSGAPAETGVNVRRFKELPVQDANVAPGRARANARQVPVNRVPEPYVPDAELPVIKAGRTPRAAGMDLQDIGAPSVYAPKPTPIADTKTIVYRGETSARSTGGVIKGKAEFGDAPFVSFTDNPELASRFGERVDQHPLDMSRILDLESSSDKKALAIIGNEIDPSLDVVKKLKKLGYDGIAFENLENAGITGREIRFFGDFAPDAPAVRTAASRPVAYDPELRMVPESAQALRNPARTRPDSSVANTSTKGPAPKPRAVPAAPRADITPPRRPVTMDIPRKTATVPVREPKAGEAVTKAKAASDVNKKLAALGFDELDEQTLPGIASISKEDQVAKAALLLEDWESAKAMAYGERPVPDGVAPQVLFNAVKNKAVQEADGEVLSRLARSKIATERSQAAQTLGSSGFNNEPADALAAIRDVEKARSDTAARRRQPSDVKKEAKSAESFIKKARAKETWDSVIDGLTC